MSDLEQKVAKLEQQLELLTEERAIIRVLLALSRTVDQKDFAGLATLYSKEGTLITPWATHSGEGLAEFVSRDLGHFDALHHISAGHEVWLEPGSRSATARMTLHATHVSNAERMEFTTVGGYYDIKLIKEDGAWRLLRVAPHPQWRFQHGAQTIPTHQTEHRWIPAGTSS